MSRFTGYIGAAVPLSNVLLAPSHNLQRQSRAASEQAHSPLNADGFGLGWFNDNQGHRYSQPGPIWQDANLHGLATSLKSHCLGGIVNNYDDGSLHRPRFPLAHHDMLFFHDGFIEDFDYSLRPVCRDYLSPEVAADMEGHSVADYLFAMLRQRLLDPDHVSVEVALLDMLSTLEVSLSQLRSQLNILVLTQDRLLAARHATQIAAPSLYYSFNHPDYPQAGLVSSEKLDDGNNWLEVPEHHFIVIRDNLDFRLTRL